MEFLLPTVSNVASRNNFKPIFTDIIPHIIRSIRFGKANFLPRRVCSLRTKLHPNKIFVKSSTCVSIILRPDNEAVVNFRRRAENRHRSKIWLISCFYLLKPKLFTSKLATEILTSKAPISVDETTFSWISLLFLLPFRAIVIMIWKRYLGWAKKKNEINVIFWNQVDRRWRKKQAFALNFQWWFWEEMLWLGGYFAHLFTPWKFCFEKLMSKLNEIKGIHLG